MASTIFNSLHGAAIKQERADKAKEAQKKHKKNTRGVMVKPYPCSDRKTVFYCSSEEKGAEAVARYERRLKQYTGL